MATLDAALMVKSVCVIVFDKELTRIESVNDLNEYKSIDIDEDLNELEKEMLDQ